MSPRGAGRVAAAMFLSALPAPGATPAERCRQVLAREAWKLERRAVGSLAACEDRKVRGVLPAATSCPAEPRTAGVLRAAGVRLGAKVGRACGGRDRTCGRGGDDVPLAETGWDMGTCPEAEEAGPLACPEAVTHCGEIAGCLACLGADSARAIETYHAPLDAGEFGRRSAMARCQRAVGRGAAALLAAATKATGQCWEARVRGQHDLDCPGGHAPTRQRIARAARQRSKAVCRACGGADRRCGGSDDVGPFQAEFAPSCEAPAPGILDATCGGGSSLDEILACLDCAAGSRAACGPAAALPGADAFVEACRPPPRCCGAQRVEITIDGGFLKIGPPALPLALEIPGGFTVVLEVGPPDPACRHPVVIPPGGFFVPAFCVDVLGVTALVEPSCTGPQGCVGASCEGSGSVWDGHAMAPDPDVLVLGDTSDGTCNPPGQLCTTADGQAGDNRLGDVDTVLGGGLPRAPGFHAQIQVPVRLVTWKDADGACPDEDGLADEPPDREVVRAPLNFTLTTGGTASRFEDKDGDGCSFVGVGPGGAGLTAEGAPAPGPCCEPGQVVTLATVGPLFLGTGGRISVNDTLFRMTLDGTVTACGPWSGAATCDLPPDECRGFVSP